MEEINPQEVVSMKEKAIARGLYILMVVCVLLPWFTYNPKMMGYCWGWQFLLWMSVPMIGTGIAVFQKEHRALIWVSALVCQIVNLMILVLALGRWQEVCNIRAGFQWQDGLETATAGYWMTVCVFFVFFWFCIGKLIRCIAGKRNVM